MSAVSVERELFHWLASVIFCVRHLCHLKYLSQCHHSSTDYLFTFNKFIYFIILFYLLIFGCVGSSLLPWAFSSCSKRGLLFVEVRGLLIAVASLVVEHGL